MNFLILYTAYNAEDLIKESIQPFLDHPDCYVAAGSRRFAKFDQPRNDNTVDLLNSLWEDNDSFLCLDTSDEPLEYEHEGKNEMLQMVSEVTNKPFDYIWIVDADEKYTIGDINRIIQFVNNPINKYIVWFSLCLKNYIFNKNTYLTEPFTPPRIFRTGFHCNWTQPNGYFFLNRFFWDNDICYIRKEDLENEQIPEYSYKGFPNMTILKEKVWVDHHSWLNDERSKSKVEYQMKHFGDCSFKWVEGSGLEFNEDYYKRNNLELPEVEVESYNGL